jgi:hypothetical protein
MSPTRPRRIVRRAVIAAVVVLLPFSYVEGFVVMPWLVAHGYVNGRVDSIVYAPLHLWCELRMPGTYTLLEMRHRAATDGRF